MLEAASVGGAALGALARRGEAVAAAARAVLRSTMAGGCRSLRDGCSAVGGGAARVLREYSPMRGSTGGKRAARPRAWWVLCALRGRPPCGAHTEGHSGVVWVLGVRVVTRVGARGRHRPIRTARRTPSRPITRRSPSHRRPMGRGLGLRSAIAPGESCAAGGAGAGRCDPSRLLQVCLCK